MNRLPHHLSVHIPEYVKLLADVPQKHAEEFLHGLLQIAYNAGYSESKIDQVQVMFNQIKKAERGES
jgi:hypothetical protein